MTDATSQPEPVDPGHDPGVDPPADGKDSEEIADAWSEDDPENNSDHLPRDSAKSDG